MGLIVESGKEAIELRQWRSKGLHVIRLRWLSYWGYWKSRALRRLTSQSPIFVTNEIASRQAAM